MPNDVTEELIIELLGRVNIDEKSAKAAGEKAGKKVQDGIESVIGQMKSPFAKMSQDFSKSSFGGFRDAIANKVVDTAIKNQIAQIQAAREAVIPTPKEHSWNDSFGGLNNATERVESFMDAISNSTGVTLFVGTLKTIGDGFKKLGKKIQDTMKPLKGFFAAIKRIAIYRAIRAALKAITQGLQEGRQNAYQWAVVTGNQFARSMDMMATSALYLKNSLGAMTMPLTNYLAPIVDRLIDQFVNLINVVNRFVATITGAGSWVKALKYPAQYMEQAAGSAKELKNQLLGFDDLNVLNANKGSGNASAMDYSSMFQEMELAGEGVNFTKSLMEAIKNSDWDALEELLDEHINGLIERIDAKGIAKSLGEKLNKAIRLVHTLLKAVDFQQIGFKIGEFISNLQLDWSTIAQTWVRWKTFMYDILIGLIDGINWANVGRSLGDWIKGLFNGFSSWLNEVNWEEAGAKIFQAFLDLIGSIDWNGIFRAFYSALWGILNAVWSGLSGAWRTLIKLFTGDLSLSDLVNGIHHSGMSYYEGVHISIGGNEHVTGGGRHFAGGGFPEQGTYFYAGENGAEFVGQVGGRTGVYNADQMTGALATANQGVVNTLTAVGNAIVSAINHKDMSINTNDVRKAINGMNMRYGV